jgi:hypothetical protein
MKSISRGERLGRTVANQHRLKPQKYAVALSFAGDDRPFAEAVASGLQEQGIAVFYDRFEEHELWGRNLHEALRDVYTRECRYCVLILSPAYLSRMWPIFERRQIIDRMATEHGQDAVLPVRLNGFQDEVPGLSGGVGYLSVSKEEHLRVVDALLRKLGEPGYEVDSAEAYYRALKMIKDRQRGVLAYDRIYTSIEVIKSRFKSLIPGEVLNWLGHEFYWKRESGHSLLMLAKNDALDEHKQKGLVNICQFDAPATWVGCGRWQVMWPDTKKKDRRSPNRKSDSSEKSSDFGSEILLLLYLYSENSEQLSCLMENEEASAAFLGGIHLNSENADDFYSAAEERFADLR